MSKKPRNQKAVKLDDFDENRRAIRRRRISNVHMAYDEGPNGQAHLIRQLRPVHQRAIMAPHEFLKRAVNGRLVSE
jgi:hypothetical protein